MNFQSVDGKSIYYYTGREKEGMEKVIPKDKSQSVNQGKASCVPFSSSTCFLFHIPSMGYQMR